MNIDEMDLGQLAVEANKDRPNFNKLKLLEEIHEFSELLVKSMTKTGDNAVSKERLAEEFGDLIVRGFVYLAEEGLEDAVESRIESKMETLEKHYRERLKTKLEATV
jgi:hypothetical protein